MTRMHKQVLQLAYREPTRCIDDKDVHEFILFIDRNLRAVFAVDESTKTVAIGQPTNSTDTVAALSMLLKIADHHIGQLIGTRWRVQTKGGVTIIKASAENIDKHYVSDTGVIDHNARNTYEANVFHMHEHYALPDMVAQPPLPLPTVRPLPHEEPPGERCQAALDDKLYEHHSGVLPPTTPELAKAIVDEVLDRMAGNAAGLVK